MTSAEQIIAKLHEISATGPCTLTLDGGILCFDDGTSITLPPLDTPDEQALYAKFRAAAQKLHHVDVVCEIDEDALVSLSEDDGAYVAAWVWVDNDDAGVESIFTTDTGLVLKLDRESLTWVGPPDGDGNPVEYGANPYGMPVDPDTGIPLKGEHDLV